jgi:3,4-dihydroxy 2-butanone 4-phosphate synthase/GTP cyclohydrolase II
MTNNPKKRVALGGYGLEIVERVPIEVAPGAHNAHYLRTKRDRMGHELAFGDGLTGHDAAVLGKVLGGG